MEADWIRQAVAPSYVNRVSTSPVCLSRCSMPRSSTRHRLSSSSSLQSNCFLSVQLHRGRANRWTLPRSWIWNQAELSRKEEGCQSQLFSFSFSTLRGNWNPWDIKSDAVQTLHFFFPFPCKLYVTCSAPNTEPPWKSKDFFFNWKPIQHDANGLQFSCQY